MPMNNIPLVAQKLLGPNGQQIMADDPQQQQQAPPQQGGGGLVGALGQVFGGPNDPALSAAQNQAAQRQGLMQAGLATMMASQGRAGQPRPSLGAALATGAMAGQKTASAARRKQQIASIMDGVDVSTPQGIASAKAALLPLLASGDAGAVQMMNALNSMLPSDGAQVHVSRDGDMEIGRDKVTGQILWQNEVELSSEEQRKIGAEIRGVQLEERREFANDYRSTLQREGFDTLARYGRVAEIAQRGAEASGVTDDMLVNAYSQLIDPSVVREGDYQRVLNASGALDRGRSLIQRYMQGEKFGPETREELIRGINEMVAAHENAFQRTVRSPFVNRAQSAGFDDFETENMFPDPFTGINLPHIDLGSTGDGLDGY